jgi:ABC-type phosphate transport system substrate-binding protein
MKRYIILTVFVCLGLAIQAQTFKVIVNVDNSTTSLSPKELSDIFLKKHLKWKNNENIIPVDMSSRSAVREDFSNDIHGKTISAIKSYWQQFVFAGKGTPPIEKNSDIDVVEFVKKNSGAIGYVSLNSDVSGVKVVSLNK